jgi:predicted TIM-barrel enzyme
MTKFSRNDVLQRLKAETAKGRSILAVGAGNGLSARCAELGGADLIVVYNSGYYRVNGLPSLVGAIPVGDANDVMLRLGRQAIMPKKRTIPVIAGVYGIDPTRDIDDLLDEVKAIGYSGIINFPTISRHENSNYRIDLENAGFGFACEVDMMRKARERDLFTLAYVYNAEDAHAMAEVGVDVVVGHMGLTTGGDIGSKSAIGIDAAITRIGEIFDAAVAADPEVILLSHGGPISTAEDAEYVNLNSKAVGFVAASSFERIPIEIALKKACDDFKSIKIA